MRILILAAVACNGDKTTDGETAGTGDTGGTTEPVTYDPTWAGVEQLFADQCDRCHPSVQQIDLHDPYTLAYYVIPGDPDDSVLWQVLSQDPPPFPNKAMPYDVGLLPSATVDHVRVWIQNGAVME